MDLVIDKEFSDINALSIVFKMMLNNKDNKDDIVALFSPITQELYKSSSDDMIQFTKDLMMKVEPWKDRLKTLFSTFDNAVNSLYGILFGFTNYSFLFYYLSFL